MSIYNHERALERTEERIENAVYSEENKRLIIRFENFLFAQGLSTPLVLKYLQQLHIIHHLFRHLRSTNLAQYLTESQMK